MPISAALGMARTRDIMRGENHVIAVVGNGALTGGMCYEALNDAGQTGTRMIVVLNDNEMSIAKNVGAMQKYLTHLRQSRTYRNFKRRTKIGLERVPVVGMPILRAIEKCRDVLKSMLLDGEFFSALGCEYIGPVDGHDLKQLINVLRRSRDAERPVILHVLTQKGRGYEPAENHPDRYHGVAPFYIESGESKQSSRVTASGTVAVRRMIELAETDMRICAITAAMPAEPAWRHFRRHIQIAFSTLASRKSTLSRWRQVWRQAECGPMLQFIRHSLSVPYDQMLIDVCRNDLAVTFLIDRAGLVGADGATHQGVFDLSYLRSMPNMIVAAPARRT